MRFSYPYGATPLSDTDLEGLIPGHIGRQSELNAWEQQNILEARQRLRIRGPSKLLTDASIRLVHRRMFDRTWRWAGRYRTSEKNIGIDWTRIPEQVVQLCADTQYWIDHGTFTFDDALTRFHHRLVQIHPFPNGNGRHARLVTDLVLESLGKAPFTWGNSDLTDPGDTRDRYIHALQAADRHDYGPLSGFVKG